MTRGEKETLVYNGKQFFEIKTYPVTPIDTTGAGDIFAGAFLHALTSGASFEKAADIANFAASKVITKYGPRLEKNAIHEILNHA